MQAYCRCKLDIYGCQRSDSYCSKAAIAEGADIGTRTGDPSLGRCKMESKVLRVLKLRFVAREEKRPVIVGKGRFEYDRFR